jgi:hypothetical protein
LCLHSRLRQQQQRRWRLTQDLLGESLKHLGGEVRWSWRGVLTPLMPPKLGCHPQHDTKGAGTKICKCSSEINMKSGSAQIIPM